MLKEFKDFISRGNVLDLAVGVIIGAAFGKIVTTLVESVIMPPIGLILGSVDFSSLFLVLDSSKGIPMSLAEAKAKGHRLVVLVGDEPYYGKCGFKRVARGRVTMPGPVDPARLLVCELVEGAFEGVTGPLRPEWENL